MLEIVIPMAGLGTRFKEAGYLLPKPFIDVAGKPMITRVMDSITPSQPHRFQLLDRATVGHTEGAVDTLLHADIDPANPVLVANCDQLYHGSINDFLLVSELADVGVMTFPSTNPHHSYVTYTPSSTSITEIAEKQVISPHAVVGIYWFSTGQLLMDYANKVIANNTRFRGEFYLSEVLRLMLDDGVDMCGYAVPPNDIAMLGTPEELTAYLATLQ